MNTIVIEHLPVAELPPAWRAKLAKSTDALVTVRIEEEAQGTAPTEEFVTDDPAFGIWRDREDMADVAGYIRSIRASRFNDDDMPTEIDFSKGTRGKFFRPDAALNLPVYLDAEVQAYLSARAKARGVDVGQLVNELLKKDIELIEVAR